MDQVSQPNGVPYVETHILLLSQIFIVLSPVLSCREEQSLAEEEVKAVTEDSIVEEPGRDQDKDKHQCTHFWIDSNVPSKEIVAGKGSKHRWHCMLPYSPRANSLEYFYFFFKPLDLIHCYPLSYPYVCHIFIINIRQIYVYVFHAC